MAVNIGKTALKHKSMVFGRINVGSAPSGSRGGDHVVHGIFAFTTRFQGLAAW
jgi:hypothetical protein